MDTHVIITYITMGFICIVCAGLATCLFAIAHHVYTTRGGKTRTNVDDTSSTPHTTEIKKQQYNQYGDWV